MADPVVFPDAEGLIAAELRDRLPDTVGEDVTVGTVIPADRPDWLVVVRRVGGPRLNLVADNPTLAVESWAPTEKAAHDLAQLARAFVMSLAGTVLDGVAVYRAAEVSGPQNFPDPLSDSPRYSFTVTVALRGAAMEAGS